MMGCQATDIVGSIKAQVISADNTAPVRLGINFCLDKNFIKNANTLIETKKAINKKAQEIEADAILTAEETPNTGDGEEYKDAQEAKKDATKFAKKAKAALDTAKESLEYATKQEERAKANPVGMNMSYLFSGIAIYFIATIEVSKVSTEVAEDSYRFDDNEDNDETFTGEAGTNSRTSKSKKVCIGIMDAKMDSPSWRDIIFSDFFNQEYI